MLKAETYRRMKQEIDYLLLYQELLSASEKQELTDSLKAIELELALRDREAERKRLLSDYYYFLKQAWAWVENVTLVENWHLPLMCRYLQALQSRKPFRDLIINIPPGCSKSLTTMVVWPAWVFAKDPAERIICASHDEGLVKNQMAASKRLMQSDWYQSFFGDTVQIADGVNRATYFETTAGGSRYSTTPGGRITGRHPTILACDDLSDPKKAESQVERESLIEWWDGTVETRGAAAEMNRARVLIAQRLHEKDIPGHVMANDVDKEWARLVIPMRHEPGVMKDIGLGNDPRKQPGDLLDPVRFPEKVVRGIERRLGPYGTASQLQQRPAPKTGGKFKIEEIRFVELDAVPINRIARFKRAWDRAGTQDDGDFTSGALGGIALGPIPKLFVFDIARGQWGTDQVMGQMALWAKVDEKRFGYSKYEVVFERGATDAGIQAAKETIRRLKGRRVRAIRPVGSKELRAEPIANAIAAGEVYFVNGPWVTKAIQELREFPKGSHDDQVDSLSLLYSELIGGSLFEDSMDDEDRELFKCGNERCNRMAEGDSKYCCDSCREADERGEALHESAHCPECAYRHSQLFASGLWEPGDV